MLQSGAGHIRGEIMSREVTILLDTGAGKYSFVSKEVADYMLQMGCEQEAVNIEGRLGDKDCKWRATKRIKIPLDLRLKPYGVDDKRAEVWALVFDNLCFDVVLGLPHLRELQLLGLLEKVLTQVESDDDSMNAMTDVESDEEEPEMVQAISDVDDPDMIKITVLGPESLQVKLTMLVKEYADLASNSIVDKQLEGVKPMTIDLVETVYNKPRSPFRGHNRHPPSVLDEIEKATKELLEKGIIEPSDGEFLQPVLLVSKKDGSLRFCIDFRFLNKITRVVNWPIPDIHVLVQRLKGYRYYGTLDLTSGYHQLVLDPKSRWLTSFMTSRGTWQFKRVPFGLRNAPAIFQRVMMEILDGLVGNICEIYIDDVIIFGNTEEEFVERVRMVFQRFRERGVIIKPSKCVLGATSIEYLGYRIDQEGYQLCEGRLDALRNLRKPTTATELKSFIGLVNCFRDFVHGLSLYFADLTKIGYGKKGTQSITWTPAAEQAFERVKEAALSCKKLHFLQDYGEIILYTDASDNGCGGSLVQVVNGKEQPIAFVSKLFTDVQRRWPTNEKEMFGILFSIEKLHHLLALRKFIVKCDHRNLSFDERMSASPKVERWKLRLQQYNYITEYIRGEDNTVADALSRLCIMDHAYSQDDIKNLIGKYHNNEVGHHGARRTLLMMQKEGNRWRDQMHDVELFIKECPLCQRQAMGRKGLQGPQFTVQANYRLEKYSADLVGPLKTDSRGQNHIVVMVDCFTKFVLLAPVEVTGSNEVIEILHTMFNQFGHPRELLTDNGPTFASNAMKEFVKEKNIIHDTSIPYNSQGNAICERMNREIRRHLDNLALEKGPEVPWSLLVSDVQRILNSSPTGTGALTPADMVMGYNVHDWQRTQLVGTDVLTDRATLQARWAETLRNKILQSNEEQAENLNHQTELKQLGRKEKILKQLQSGNWIMVRNATRAKGDIHKAKWRGPAQVVSHHGREVKYRDFISGAVFRVDIESVRLYQAPEGEDPQIAAARNGGEFVIESIQGHEFAVGKRHCLKNLTLKIKWLGYSDIEEETFGENDSLIANEKVLEYLEKTSELRHLVPKRFKK